MNPYHPGKIPARRDDFFGRTDLATWIEQQLILGRRVLLLHGPGLIGKSSLIHHLPHLFSSTTLTVQLSLAQQDDFSINAVLQTAAQTLAQHPALSQQPAAAPLNFQADFDPSAAPLDVAADAFAQIDQLLSQLENLHLGKTIFWAIDDFHLLAEHSPQDMAYFLDVGQSLLSRHQRLGLGFFTQNDTISHLPHPLLTTAPIQQIGPLSASAAVQMVTQPLEGSIRFDYGVPKRIADINSNHPYYIALFNHTLFIRCARDGWVNLRHLDDTLEAVLSQDIAPLKQIWGQASALERAILAAMASVRASHGMFTRQEVASILSKQDKHADEAMIVAALEALHQRGILVKMGALSYKFHVDLFRYWIQRRFTLADMLASVKWNQPAPPPEPTSEAPPAQAKPRRRRWPLIVAGMLSLVVIGLIMLSLFPRNGGFLGATPPTATALESVPGFAVEVVNTPAPTATPEPTATPTPTPPIVVARSLPSVAFMSRQGDDPWQIVVMNADGSEVTPVINSGGNDMTPTWSPGGGRLVFVTQRDGNREIYVSDLDGQNQVNISNHPADDWTPAWSPDGKQLVFSSNRTGNWEIFTVNADGSDLQQITNTGNGNISPAWSPDGESVVFSSKRDENWEIYRMDLDGSNVRRLTNNAVNDFAPVWSPDGQLIAYETNLDGNVEVYVMDSLGGNQRNVSQFSIANDHGPVWTPDGQTLIFYSNRTGSWDVYSMDLTGGKVINVTNTPDMDEQTPVWRP